MSIYGRYHQALSRRASMGSPDHAAMPFVRNKQEKLDPGSKSTGIALVAHGARRGAFVVWAAVLDHRGAVIQKKLNDRQEQKYGNLV